MLIAPGGTWGCMGEAEIFVLNPIGKRYKKTKGAYSLFRYRLENHLSRESKKSDDDN
jgi:hypothetical protein